MNFIDTVNLGDARLTRDGYLVTDAKIARTGIQLYAGVEVGRPDMPTVRVYRSEAEVFSKDSLASFAHRPVTIDHPHVRVTADNWREFAVGDTGGDVARDGEYVRVPLTLMDKSAISAVQSGKRQLSAGYSCDLEWTAGTTPQGEAYDAMQVGIRANHLAVVDAARAGPVCRIGDDTTQASNHKDYDMTLQKVTVDGITVEMSDTAAQVVSKVQTQLSDALAKIQSNDATIQASAKALETKDGEIAALKAAHQAALDAKDGEVAAIKAQVPTPDALDALATARADLISQARVVLGATFDAKGKSEAQIRKEVVAHSLGDAAKDMSDAAIQGAFTVVIAKRPADPIQRASAVPAAPQAVAVGDAMGAYAQMKDRLANEYHTTQRAS
jgi:hypothetical protein